MEKLCRFIEVNVSADCQCVLGKELLVTWHTLRSTAAVLF